MQYGDDPSLTYTRTPEIAVLQAGSQAAAVLSLSYIINFKIV